MNIPISPAAKHRKARLDSILAMLCTNGKMPLEGVRLYIMQAFGTTPAKASEYIYFLINGKHVKLEGDYISLAEGG